MYAVYYTPKSWENSCAASNRNAQIYVHFVRGAANQGSDKRLDYVADRPDQANQCDTTYRLPSDEVLLINNRAAQIYTSPTERPEACTSDSLEPSSPHANCRTGRRAGRQEERVGGVGVGPWWKQKTATAGGGAEINSSMLLGRV